MREVLKRMWIGVWMFLLMSGGAWAQEEARPPSGGPGSANPQASSRPLPDGPAAVEALIEILQEKAVITPEEAAVIRNRLDSRELRMEADKVIRIIPEQDQKEYMEMMTREVAREINENVKADVKRELKKEIASDLTTDPGFLEEVTPRAPEWAKRIRFGGDIRLRYQADQFDENNTEFIAEPGNPTELMNTREDRNRVRYRVRVSAEAKVTEDVSVGLRLATGNEKDPVSTNDTLGDYLNKDGINLDRAYLRWNAFEGAALWGGRFPNPFFYSDLVWDSDVNFEGGALSWERPFTEKLTGFASAAAISIQEVEFSRDDKWLYGGQLGVRYKPRKDLIWKLGAAYYDYDRITGKRIDPTRPESEFDFTLPGFQQKGNLLMDIDPGADFQMALAADYDLINLTGTVEIAYYYPIWINLLADYVRNIGFDADEAADNTGLDKDFIEEITGAEGYQFGILVGYPKVRDRWQWSTSLYWKHLESDAVLDAFTDSDFHLGGTNAEGWTLTGQIGLARNIWMGFRWLTADEITGDPLAIDILQIDLNAVY
jgi:hypothetical protein